MTAILPIQKAKPLRATAFGWRAHLAALSLVAAAILLLFHSDAADMVAVWAESATFNHCFLILPLIGWLVWQRLPELRQLVPAAWALGLLLVALGGAGWLLGYAGGAAVARHAGLVLMLQGSVVACLGKDVSRALAFPIFYALFLIPVGQELVPPLQTLTAEISMALLALIGVPAHIEGIFITTPTGYFQVAEACSGIQFLIAMAVYGVLVANVCFRSWPRRLLFIAAAIAIPILANGVRAFAIIWIAHLTTIEFAASTDHIVFGWVFFGIVMAMLMGAGWRFFDRRPGEPWFDAKAIQPAPPGSSALAPIAAGALALAVLPLAWSAAVSSAPQPLGAFALPDVGGWQRLPASTTWRPHYQGADRMLMARYRNAADQEVDLAVAVYSAQAEGRELIGFGHGAVAPNSRWAWTGTGTGHAPPGGRLERLASHGRTREVAIFYRVGNILTGSDYAAKLETVKTRLLGGPPRAVAVLISAEGPAAGVSPRPAIDSFLAALGPVEGLADGAAGISELPR